MATVSRNDFRRTLARGKGSLNVHDLPKALQQRLLAAGVDTKKLERMAGKDGQLRGHEFDGLFDAVETVDENGSGRSFESGTEDSPTQAGEFYSALKNEVDQRRTNTHLGVIHLGMRMASSAEVDALAKSNGAAQGGVVSIAPYAGGLLHYADAAGQERVFNLAQPAGLRDFAKALAKETGDTKQATGFVDFLRGQKKNVRDKLAQLGLALLNAKGQKSSRLVLSGHSYGDSLFGGPNVAFSALGKLAKFFPEGASRIKDVMLSACNTGYEEHINIFRDAFPNLKSYVGYVGPSPLAEEGAPRHIRHWEARTDGDDPSRVDPGPGNMATWNVADGRQEKRPLSLKQTRKLVADNKDKVESDTRTPQQHGRDLYNYYQSMTRLTYHADLPATEKAALNKKARGVYNLYVAYSGH